MKIAHDIQLSLLPQTLPPLKHFDLSVIYEPTNEVGGDYYDILKRRQNSELPILIADVEGKGLPAALLAASYFFEPGKFISKANSLICEFTRGQRFITLFWMLVNDENRSITYVNAGHVEPLWISATKVTRLSRGGFLTGFVDDAHYEKETLTLAPGDLLVTFTDGVPEVENNAGDEYGVKTMIEFLVSHRHLAAGELSTLLFNRIKDFSQGRKFRDDFTLILLKAK